MTTRRGQALVETAIVLPVLLVLTVGVIELGFAIYQYVSITSLAREGANMISRQTTFTDAETALQAAATGPASLGANGRCVLSVVQLGTSGANNGKPIIAQRHALGSLAATSVLGEPPAGAYGGGPDYYAQNPTGDTSIQVSGPLPNGLTISPGTSVYVAEFFVRRATVVPLVAFGLSLPNQLYASAYF
jgi:Flp pilus assembly protein TadG